MYPTGQRPVGPTWCICAGFGAPQGFGYGSKSFTLQFVKDMFSETAEQLKEFCVERIGDDLRAVIEYTDEGIQSTYFRDDVNGAVEDLSMDVLHNPVLALHRNGWRVTEMFEHFGPPTATLQAYEDKLLFTFPFDETTGIFVSVDRKEAYIADLFGELESLVQESDRGER